MCFDHEHTHTFTHTHTQRHPPAVACITWLGSLRSADADDARRAVVAVSRVYVYVCGCVCVLIRKRQQQQAGRQQRLRQQQQQQRRQRLSNLNSFAIFSFIFVANKVDCSRGCFVWLVNTIHTIQSIHCCCECTQVSFAVCAVFSSLFKQSLLDRD